MENEIGKLENPKLINLWTLDVYGNKKLCDILLTHLSKQTFS